MELSNASSPLRRPLTLNPPLLSLDETSKSSPSRSRYPSRPPNRHPTCSFSHRTHTSFPPVPTCPSHSHTPFPSHHQYTRPRTHTHNSPFPPTISSHFSSSQIAHAALPPPVA